MSTQAKPATVSLPLTALKFLYTNTRKDKIVCEINVDALKKVNKPATIDEMVAEAKLEYFSGKTKGFKNIDKLINYLNS